MQLAATPKFDHKNLALNTIFRRMIVLCQLLCWYVYQWEFKLRKITGSQFKFKWIYFALWSPGHKERLFRGSFISMKKLIYYINWDSKEVTKQKNKPFGILFVGHDQTRSWRPVHKNFRNVREDNFSMYSQHTRKLGTKTPRGHYICRDDRNMWWNNLEILFTSWDEILISREYILSSHWHLPWVSILPANSSILVWCSSENLYAKDICMCRV